MHEPIDTTKTVNNKIQRTRSKHGEIFVKCLAAPLIRSLARSGDENDR
jgi:hypothetical protein